MERKFIDQICEVYYRESVLDSLCNGNSELRDILDYVIDEKLKRFSNIEDTSESNDEITELVLPAVRRVWSKVFIEPPGIFKASHFETIPGFNKRLTYFQLLFSIDKFIDYLYDSLNKNMSILNYFEYLDRSSELLTLIVDNYIAMLINKVSKSENLEMDIRDERINKILK
jgi:hypothetical protein